MYSENANRHPEIQRLHNSPVSSEIGYGQSARVLPSAKAIWPSSNADGSAFSRTITQPLRKPIEQCKNNFGNYEFCKRFRCLITNPPRCAKKMPLPVVRSGI